MAVEIGIALFYSMASVIVVGLIKIVILDGSNGFYGEKVFKEEKLSEVSDISGVAVLHRINLQLATKKFKIVFIDHLFSLQNNALENRQKHA